MMAFFSFQKAFWGSSKFSQRQVKQSRLEEPTRDSKAEVENLG
jgi:hypothetical protein